MIAGGHILEVELTLAEWAEMLGVELAAPIASLRNATRHNNGTWGDDISRCLKVLQEKSHPAVNLFGYGQVESPYGSGEFYEHINELTDEFRTCSPIRFLTEMQF